eukprot:EG_transcript_19571
MPPARPVPYTVVGHSDGVVVGEAGDTFATASPAAKCHVDLRLSRAAYLDRFSCSNLGTCFLAVLAGPDPSLLAAVLPRHPTNSMLRHKVGQHREDPLDLPLAVPDAKCVHVRVVLEQPYEPAIPIGLRAVVLFGAETPLRPSTATVEPQAPGRRLVVRAAALPGTPVVPVPDLEADPAEEDPAPAGAPLTLQALRLVLGRRHSQHEAFAQKQAAAAASPPPAVPHNAHQPLTDSGLPSPPPRLTPVGPAGSPPPLPAAGRGATAGVARAGATHPGPGCLSGVKFVLSGFQNPERSEIRDLAVSLGAAYLPDWTPTATHLIA